MAMYERMIASVPTATNVHSAVRLVITALTARRDRSLRERILMGSKITKLKPVGGFCAETGAALTLAYVTLTGTPVSTTHTITGAIVGVGSTRRVSAVKWGVAGRIVWAWVLTIPMAAAISALTFWIVRFVHNLMA